MAYETQPLTSQSNLLAIINSEVEQPHLLKLTTFGSAGSGREQIEVSPSPLLEAKPDWQGFRSMSFGGPGEVRPVIKPEEVKIPEPMPEKKKGDSPLQSQPTAAFPTPDMHIMDRLRAQERVESESSFTLGTDMSEADLERSVDEKLPTIAEDSIQIRKSALQRLATEEREDFNLVHRCCRRLQKGCFAVVSVFKDADKDWYVLRITELVSKIRCEEVLEPAHPWTAKHAAVELASLIEKDGEDHLVLPLQRLDLFTSKDGEGNLSVQTNSSDRRKSACFGPKQDAVRRKVFSGVEYDVEVELKSAGSKKEVSVSVTPVKGPGDALVEHFSQAHLRDVSISVDNDVEKLADGVVSRLQMSQGMLCLKPTISRRESVSNLIPEISGINYQTSRILNNDEKYFINFSSIPLDTGSEKTIYIDAQAVDGGTKLLQQLELDEDELRTIVDFPEGELLAEHLEQIADLLIIENGNELHLGKRHMTGKNSLDAPAIVILMDYGTEVAEYERIAYPPSTYTPPPESVQRLAAVCIQKRWRGVAAKETLQMLRTAKRKSLQFRRFVCHPEMCAVAGYRSTAAMWVSLESLQSDLSISKDIHSGCFPSIKETVKLLSSEEDPEEEKQKLALALGMQKMFRGKSARNKAASKQSEGKRVPALTKVKKIDSEQYIVSIFEAATGLEVEVVPMRPKHRGEFFKAKFAQSQLQPYLPLNLETVFADVQITEGKVELQRCANALLFSQPKVIDGKEFQLSVSVNARDVSNCRPTSVLSFQAVHKSIELLSQISVQGLAKCLGQSLSVIALAEFAVEILLEVREKGLFVNTSKNVRVATVKIQAVIRGFLARRRLRRRTASKGKLVAVTSKVMNGNKFAVYAYSDRKGMKIEATLKRKPPLVLELSQPELEQISSSVSRKVICEQFIFPNLLLTQSGSLQLRKDAPQRLRTLSVQRLAPTSISSLPPSPTAYDVHSPIHSRTLKRFDSSDISDSGEAYDEMVIPTPKLRMSSEKAGSTLQQLRKKLKRHVRNRSEVTQRKPKSDVFFIPVYEQSAPNELITKLGADISNVYFIVAMYRSNKGVSIEASQPKSKQTLKLFVNEEVPLNQKEAEIVCNSIIDRLQLKRGKSGVTLELRAKSLQVLYKRSHYISERYMVLSVLDMGDQVELQAVDPTTQKTLRLSLGKLKALSPEELYRELCVIVKRLRVESMLGEEVLVLSQ